MRRYEVTLTSDMSVQGQHLKAGDVIARIESVDVSSHVLANLIQRGDANCELVDKSADYVVSGETGESADDDPPGDADGGQNGDGIGEQAGEVNKEESSPPDLPQELIDAGLSQKVVAALVENAMSKNEERLLSLGGLRAWVGEGNSLDGDLEKIGPKLAKQLEGVLFPESNGSDEN